MIDMHAYSYVWIWSLNDEYHIHLEQKETMNFSFFRLLRLFQNIRSKFEYIKAISSFKNDMGLNGTNTKSYLEKKIIMRFDFWLLQLFLHF